jgi:hypothetical protein
VVGYLDGSLENVDSHKQILRLEAHSANIGKFTVLQDVTQDGLFLLTSTKPSEDDRS